MKLLCALRSTLVLFHLKCITYIDLNEEGEKPMYKLLNLNR
jgi:hypothetical protein